MNGQRYRETPLDIERLRRLNRATVERYMAMKGAERLQRHSLFVEDGCAGNWATESGEPLVFRGHESLRRLAEWLERCFPDWEWHNVRIFETEDPNRRVRRARQGAGPGVSGGLLREPLHPFLRTRERPDKTQSRVHEPDAEIACIGNSRSTNKT